MPKLIVPTVPSLGPTSNTADPTVRRALQTLAAAHDARNGATDKRFVTADEVASRASTSRVSAAPATNTIDDQISALMEMIAALQNAVVALQAHSTSYGYDVGNLPGNVPVNNGTLNTGLNAEKLGGKTVDEVLLGGAVVTGKTATGEYLTVTLNGVVRYIPVFA